MKVNTKLLRFALGRLAERSTFAGLGALLALAGLTVSGAQLDAVVQVVTALAGAALVFIPEGKSE
jgi:hypothetical protein